MIDEPPVHHHFILAMAAHRRAIGMTQTELADRLGVSPGQVSRWESLKSGMYGDTLFAMAEILQFKFSIVEVPQ